MRSIRYLAIRTRAVTRSTERFGLPVVGQAFPAIVVMTVCCGPSRRLVIRLAQPALGPHALFSLGVVWITWMLFAVSMFLITSAQALPLAAAGGKGRPALSGQKPTTSRATAAAAARRTSEGSISEQGPQPPRLVPPAPRLIGRRNDRVGRLDSAAGWHRAAATLASSGYPVPARTDPVERGRHERHVWPVRGCRIRRFQSNPLDTSLFRHRAFPTPSAARAAGTEPGAEDADMPRGGLEIVGRLGRAQLLDAHEVEDLGLWGGKRARHCRSLPASSRSSAD